MGKEIYKKYRNFELCAINKNNLHSYFLSLFSLSKSINANYLINEAVYRFYFLRDQAVHECNLNMDRQVCVIKAVAYRVRTDTRTDKKVKTEGPKIL